MRKVQYLHKQSDSPRRFTLLLEVPSKQELVSALLEMKPLGVLAGLAIVHPKDRFIKKVGRQVAKACSGGTKLHMLSIQRNLEGELQFTGLLDLGIEVTFVVCPKSETPFLIKGNTL